MHTSTQTDVQGRTHHGRTQHLAASQPKQPDAAAEHPATLSVISDGIDGVLGEPVHGKQTTTMRYVRPACQGM